MKMLWLALPVLMAALRQHTGQYVFSALTTIACAAVVLISGAKGADWLLAAGLLVSVAGDWFMAHQSRGPLNFFFGVGGFGIAHILFIAFALNRFRFSLPALIAAGVLLLGFGLYLILRVFPKLDTAVAAAVAGYALVSIAGFYCALSLNAPLPEKILYALGIASIVFSDTMIAEADFLHQKWAQPLILPTYYLCHILLAGSQLIR